MVKATVLRALLQVADGMGRHIGQQFRAGRCTPLVVDDRQALALLRQPRAA